MSSDSDTNVENFPPRKKKYNVSYKKDWEKDEAFMGWLTKSRKGPEFAYCKVCEINLNITKGGRSDVQKHKDTKKHEKNKLKMRGQPSIAQLIAKKNEEKSIKESEIRIAAFVVEHNIAVNAMAHFPDFIRAICPDSNMAKEISSCGRTKTTKIITEVLGKSDLEIMVDAMQNNKFSLTFDESTDKSTIKHLAAIIRISRNNLKIEDYFFELFEIIDATADKLYEIITTKMIELKIPYKSNMIGLAADGAHVMMGKNHSVATKFKEDVPNLFIMKCVCHSVHLVASNACLKLPREPEDLVRDVYNYLNGSPKRAGLLKEFQEFLELKPNKMLQPSQTRWLSLEAVVKRILEQYEALRLFFRDAVFSDRIKAAENISTMLENPINRLYLEFLEFALGIFNILNKTMQSESTKVHCIYKNVVTVINTILECYLQEKYVDKEINENLDYKNPRKYKPIEEWYLGAKVTGTISASTIHPEAIKQFKLRCLEFYIEAIKQLLQRFPFDDDMAILKKMEFMDPEVVKSRKIQSIADVLVRFPNIVERENLQKVDSEWRLLRNTEVLFDKDAESFWRAVAQMDLGDGNKMFPQLTDAVFKLMTLPHSSASVERLFSQINRKVNYGIKCRRPQFQVYSILKIY